MNVQDLVLEIAAWVLTIAGLVVIAWALFWDRARGRRRCPKCWYDMGGAKADGDGRFTCSECGRVVRRERRLFKTRRRWRRAIAGVCVLGLAYAAVAYPRVRDRGWVGAVPTTVLVFAHPLMFEHADRHDVYVALRRIDPSYSGMPSHLRMEYRGSSRDITEPSGQVSDACEVLLADLCYRSRTNDISRWQFVIALHLMLSLHKDVVYGDWLRDRTARFVCWHVLYQGKVADFISDRQLARLNSNDGIRVELPDVVVDDGGVSVRVRQRFWPGTQPPQFGTFEVYNHVSEKWQPVFPTRPWDGRSWIAWTDVAWINPRCIGPSGQIRLRADVRSDGSSAQRGIHIQQEWNETVKRVGTSEPHIVSVVDEAMEAAIARHFSEDWSGGYIEAGIFHGLAVSLIYFGNSVYVGHEATVEYRETIHRPNRMPYIDPPDHVFVRMFDGAIGLRVRTLVNGEPVAEGTVAWESVKHMIYSTGGLPGFSSMWSGPGIEIELAILPGAADIWRRAESEADSIDDINLELEISGDPNVAMRLHGAERCISFVRRFPALNKGREREWIRERIVEELAGRTRDLDTWIDAGPIGPPAVPEPTIDVELSD